MEGFGEERALIHTMRARQRKCMGHMLRGAQKGHRRIHVEEADNRKTNTDDARLNS